MVMQGLRLMGRIMVSSRHVDLKCVLFGIYNLCSLHDACCDGDDEDDDDNLDDDHMRDVYVRVFMICVQACMKYMYAYV